jgi:rhodanese-related sulfurtransferase
MIAATGVATYGELELLGFLETKVTNSTGLLLDVRAPEEFEQASIPGAVNVPFMTLAEDNRFRADILRALGATDGAGDTLDFTNAMSLTVFSGGIWSSEAITAINNLLSAGYPANKLSYFRGGMQAWVHVGLTVQ